MKSLEAENDILHPAAELDVWENEGGCCHAVNHSKFPPIDEGVLWE